MQNNALMHIHLVSQLALSQNTSWWSKQIYEKSEKHETLAAIAKKERDGMLKIMETPEKMKAYFLKENELSSFNDVELFDNNRENSKPIEKAEIFIEAVTPDRKS